MWIKKSSIRVDKKPNNAECGKQMASMKWKQSNINVNRYMLVDLIKQGYSFIFANYKTKEGTVSKEDIENIQLLTFDVETQKDKTTKEFVTNPCEIEEVEEYIKLKYGISPIVKYFSFSHSVEDPRARLIYLLEKPVTWEEYEQLMTVFIKEEYLKERLDEGSAIANKMWQGTNKEVILYDTFKVMKEEQATALIEEGKNLRGKEEEIYKPKVVDPTLFCRSNKEATRNITELSKKVFLDFKYMEEIKDTINSKINIIDYLERHFSYRVPRGARGNKFNSGCPIHKGDSEKNFTVYLDTNTAYCWGDCKKRYTVLGLAYEYYGLYDFNQVVLSLIEEYNINIPEEWIKIF